MRDTRAIAEGDSLHRKSPQSLDPERSRTDRQGAKSNAKWPTAAAATALLVPCFWQRHIEAGDLASHLYNAWLAVQIQHGMFAGLTLAHPLSNVLIDWILVALIVPLGPAWTARLVCAAAVQIFFWGAFRFITVAVGPRPWFMAPYLGMLAYGLIFHFGFLNFYVSSGLCLWIVALLWRPTVRGLLLSIPLAILSVLALPLSLAWAVSILAYSHATRRNFQKRRVPLLIAGISILISVRILLMRMFASQWSFADLTGLRGFLGFTGVLQFWLFGPKYLLLAGIVLVHWFLLFVRRADRGNVTSDPLIHLWFLNMLAFLLLPSRIELPHYQLGLYFISERVSFFVAILFCAIVSGLRPGRGTIGISVLLAMAFFAFLYVDVRAINGVDSKLTALVSNLPPDQRVTASMRDSGANLNSLAHVLDWACIGHCFDYANYEPPSAAFRIRVLGNNAVVASTIGIVQEIEYSRHVVTEQEEPLYSLCPIDLKYRFELVRLYAGETTCSFSLAITPRFLERPAQIR